jgi:hypothetical protein
MVSIHGVTLENGPLSPFAHSESTLAHFDTMAVSRTPSGVPPMGCAASSFSIYLQARCRG